MSTFERQPLLTQGQQVQDALDQIGAPLSAKLKRDLRALKSVADDQQVTRRVQELLDPLCLAKLSLRHKAVPLVVSRVEDVELIELDDHSQYPVVLFTFGCDDPDVGAVGGLGFLLAGEVNA